MKRNDMKKAIIPVCLACVMLVMVCKKDTGGVQEVIDLPAGHATHENKGKPINNDTEKIKTVGKKTETGKKNSAIPDTNRDRKPVGLLVKPRVDVPEVK
jgi:hypothetical protein